ncbi:MAG: hypothetical protein ACREP9_15260 [Candidatus Dormibacteraceae bacterium]
MREEDHLTELTVRVPGPFAGIEDLGFSARYPDQPLLAPLHDVAIWIEGPTSPMRRLTFRLQMLAANRSESYRWTDPITLSDQVVVMAFHDRRGPAAMIEPPQASLNHMLNLVRPVVFPFLQDCAQVADLRLSDQIILQICQQELELATLNFQIEEVVTHNGYDSLAA